MSDDAQEVVAFIVFGIIAAVVACGLAILLVRDYRSDKKRYQERCDHIAVLAGGKQATIDANNDCYFVKDGKLEIVE